MESHKKINLFLLLFISSNAFFLLVAGEIFLRIKHLPKTPMDDYREHSLIPDAILGFKYMPNVSARYKRYDFDNIIYTNSFGFRDYEFSLEKNSSNIKRIAVLGDSFTAGDEEQIPDIWVKVLGNKLRSEFNNIEVLNFGVGGTATVYHYRQLKEIVHKFSPDYVIVAFNSNDINYENIFFSGQSPFTFYTCTNYKGTDILYTDEQSLKTGIAKLRFYEEHPFFYQILKNSRLARACKQIFNNRYWPNKGMNVFYPRPELLKVTYEQKLQVTQEYILKIKDFCSLNKEKLIFLLMPTKHNNNPYYKDIRPFLNKQEITTIDADEEFESGHIGKKQDYFFVYDDHPNKKGHEVIAKIAYNKVRTLLR